MCLAAAYELASYAEEQGLTENKIIPNMNEIEVYAREASAVGMKAIEEGIAQIRLDKTELYENALNIITRSRNITKNQMQNKFIFW